MIHVAARTGENFFVIYTLFRTGDLGFASRVLTSTMLVVVSCFTDIQEYIWEYKYTYRHKYTWTSKALGLNSPIDMWLCLVVLESTELCTRVLHNGVGTILGHWFSIRMAGDATRSFDRRSSSRRGVVVPYFTDTQEYTYTCRRKCKWDQ
jgi:hypothetical protein